jgi:hypothetical protein
VKGDDWPDDPNDPRCPECGEPVSATAIYCMHCSADLPPAGFGATEPMPADGPEATRTDDGGSTVTDDARSTQSDGVRSTQTDDARSTLAGGATTTPAAANAAAAEPGQSTRDERAETAGWLHPHSLLDDVSTGVVGVVGGLLVGVVTAPVSTWLLPDALEAWTLPMTLGAWFAATVWIARTRTVFGAVRKAGLAVGGLVALVPIAVSIALGDASGLLLGIVLWPVALVVAGVGYAVGYVDYDASGS